MNNEVVLLSEAEISRTSQQLLLGDGAVAFVLKKGKEHQTARIRQDLYELAQSLDVANTKQKLSSSNHSRNAKRIVERIELASCGICLLMLKQHELHQLQVLGDSTNSNIQQRKRHLEREISRLELDVKKIVPGILLYRSDEEVRNINNVQYFPCYSALLDHRLISIGLFYVYTTIVGEDSRMQRGISVRSIRMAWYRE